MFQWISKAYQAVLNALAFWRKAPQNSVNAELDGFDGHPEEIIDPCAEDVINGLNRSIGLLQMQNAQNVDVGQFSIGCLVFRCGGQVFIPIDVINAMRSRPFHLNWVHDANGSTVTLEEIQAEALSVSAS